MLGVGGVICRLWLSWREAPEVSMKKSKATAAAVLETSIEAWDWVIFRLLRGCGVCITLLVGI
ncbi:hypothetical protein BKA81DRAFT_351545 [Phyllosticta paracitricarpa]